jgi:integrase/recombinase XerD
MPATGAQVVICRAADFVTAGKLRPTAMTSDGKRPVMTGRLRPTAAHVKSCGGTEAAPGALPTVKNRRDISVTHLPALIAEASPAARLAWGEFFGAMIRNRHTRAAYLHAVRRFLAWLEIKPVSLKDILPGMVGEYLDTHPGSPPTRNLHLSALRAFFDVLVNRHAIVFNPAATVRGERYEAVEGKTPEITVEQARTLLKSISPSRSVGRRDKAIIATLIYTAARAGAVAGLRLKDVAWDGTQYALQTPVA